MELIETLVYLQAVNSFLFKTIARGGFWIDRPLVYSLVKQVLVLNIIDSTLS